MDRIASVRTWVLTTLALFGVLLVVYVSDLIIPRDFHYSTLLNGWLPDAFEFIVSILCIVRGLVRQPGRAVAIILGVGLLSWGFGDTVGTYESVYGASSLTNYLGVFLWLGFYPFAYIALVFYMRNTLRALSVPSWLDGGAAGLGAGTICAAFAFHNSHGHQVHLTMLTIAANLAFPIGDLLLIALVVGAAAMLEGRPTLVWIVLATACGLNCLGDTINLFRSSEGPFRFDTIFHALAWPAAGLLMTVAVWLRPRPAPLVTHQKSASFLLPGLAAASGLIVLVVATVADISRITVVLAIATLIAAGSRLMWSAHKLRMLTEQRHRQSMTDQLTGIGNRRHLFDILDSFFLDQANPLATRHTLVFLFVDLNHFKEINDSFGHLAGDELLKQLGPRLMRSLGKQDVLVRFGGDEFGIVLMDADDDYTTSVAEQLSAGLDEPFELGGLNVSISASIGIAVAPTDATDVSQLLECADVAMYRSKLGRISFAFYDQKLDAANHWRLADELRSAIEERQFVLHYQPQLNLHTGLISGVEALVRWQHPKLGMLAPPMFLPIAEDAGLMPALTPLLLEEAITQGAKWREAGHDLTVSVNITPRNLLDMNIAEHVHQLLERHQFPPNLFVLEITETSIIEDFEDSKRVVDALAAQGIIISIDDFGAGFTSLSYLSSLAVGELKLDCKLVIDLAAESLDRERELVRSTIALGHAQGLHVVAEGVENQATLDLLRSQHCDFAQGYFIGRPMPANKLGLRLELQTSARALISEFDGELASAN